MILFSILKSPLIFQVSLSIFFVSPPPTFQEKMCFHKIVYQYFFLDNASPIISQPPEWLTLLLLCCCYNKQFDVQSSALSTLLDLVNVTLTVNYSRESNSLIGSVTMAGDSSSKITPLISSSNLKWMQKSNLFKV